MKSRHRGLQAKGRPLDRPIVVEDLSFGRLCPPGASGAPVSQAEAPAPRPVAWPERTRSKCGDGRTASATPGRPQPECPDEVIDLAIALAVDHPSGLALCPAGRGAAEAAALVAMLDGFDVAEVAGQSVELGAGRTHERRLLAGPVGQDDPLDDRPKLRGIAGGLQHGEVVGGHADAAGAVIVELGPAPAEPVAPVDVLARLLRSH